MEVPKVVGAIGFEPTTSWSQTRRSTKLSYTPMTLQPMRLRSNAHDYARSEANGKLN